MVVPGAVETFGFSSRGADRSPAGNMRQLFVARRDRKKAKLFEERRFPFMGLTQTLVSRPSGTRGSVSLQDPLLYDRGGPPLVLTAPPAKWLPWRD